MGTIFADETESTADRRGDDARSVFRNHESTDECDDAADSDDGSRDAADDVDDANDAEPATDDDARASTPTMPVFSNGERIEFEVDDR